MLVVECANGHVAWVFREIDQNTKAAICLNDNFRIQYDPTPVLAWGLVLRDIAAHSVLLQGAFRNTHYVPL